MRGGQLHESDTKAYESAPLTSMEAQIVSLRVQGRSIRAIADDLDMAPSTVFAHVKKAHVRAAINAGTQDIVDSTTQALVALRLKAISVLGDVLDDGILHDAQGKIHDRRVEAAREVLKVTEVKRSEVAMKVDIPSVIREAVAMMTDEELGIGEDDE